MKYFLAIFLLAFIMSCEKQRCKNVVWYKVSYVESDAVINENEELSVTVKFNSATSCGVLHHFYDKKDGNIIRIKTYVDTEPCAVCLMVAMPKSVNYIFKQKVSGTYYLEFQNPDGESVWDTVLVK